MFLGIEPVSGAHLIGAWPERDEQTVLTVDAGARVVNLIKKNKMT